MRKVEEHLALHQLEKLNAASDLSSSRSCERHLWPETMHTALACSCGRCKNASRPSVMSRPSPDSIWEGPREPGGRNSQLGIPEMSNPLHHLHQNPNTSPSIREPSRSRARLLHVPGRLAQGRAGSDISPSRHCTGFRSVDLESRAGWILRLAFSPRPAIACVRQDGSMQGRGRDSQATVIKLDVHPSPTCNAWNARLPATLAPPFPACAGTQHLQVLSLLVRQHGRFGRGERLPPRSTPSPGGTLCPTCGEAVMRQLRGVVASNAVELGKTG